MKNLSLIAAVGANNELGKNNDLIWHIKDDLMFFKQTTINKPIIMGYNTYLSLPHLLPKREHLVLTYKYQDLPKEVKQFTNKQDLLNYIKDYEEVFVIGGAQTYQEFINDVNKLYLTEIEATDKDAQVFFPKFDKSLYTKTIIKENALNNPPYKHILYIKKN